jgi:ADP-heptose:LPS heptosyltransferase
LPLPLTRAPTVRVLVIKRDKLGDLLLTLPVVERLAAALPQAQIHLLANDYNAWVARDHPALARTWIYPRVRGDGRFDVVAALRQVPLRRELVRQRFDWALVMGGDESHRAIRRALATRASRVVAYAREPSRYGTALTDPLAPPSAGHEVTRMLALLAPLGVRAATPEPPVFAAPPAALAFAAAWLPARGLAAREFVVIGLGARRTKKQPTPAQVASWSTRIFERHRLPTVLMWTPGATGKPGYPGDDALAQAVLDQRLAHVHPFRGPIIEALGLIFSARTSIVPDSGLMHFAAASPGGVLGLFADPLDSAPALRWAPLGPRARYLEAEKRVAELHDDDVFGALDPLLTARDGPTAAHGP